MRKQLGATIIEVVIVILACAAIVGWIWNIVQLVSAISDPITTMIVLRIVGVFVVPLGVILGYL